MKTLKDYIVASKEKYSDNIIVKTAQKNYSYKELIETSLKWSTFLEKNGCKKGERVGIIIPKSVEQIKAFYSIWALGSIALPINENSKKIEMKFILEDATPNIILTTSKLEAVIREVYPQGKIILLDKLDELSEKEEEHLGVSYDREEVAALIYTSGSTGNPKGVMLTHRNLVENGNSVVEIKSFTEEECLYSMLPYWHSFSLAIEVVGVMQSGGSIAITEGQRTFIRDIQIFQPTILLVVPRILELVKSSIEKQIKSAGEEAIFGYKKLLEVAPLVKGDSANFIGNEEHKAIYDMLEEKLLTKVKAIFGKNFREFIAGGAALDLNLQKYFTYIGLPVMQGYGLSEASPVVAVDIVLTYQLGSIGKLLPWLTEEKGGDITFLDEKGNTGKGLKGELLLKGDCVMKGYWNHSDQSAKAIKDGWLYTGDMGYYKDGNLYIIGRKTNMLVLKGGENIHPEHIENELKKSEYIDDVMVIGDGCKNLYVCITIPENYDEMDRLELNKQLKKDIKEFTNHLIPFQKPKDFLLVERFSAEDGTYTGTQKIKRHKIYQRDKVKIEKFLKDSEGK